LNDKLLILDLDETLIFATEEQLAHTPDFTFDEYNVYVRPFVREFIAFGRANFQLAVWTSASANYAKIIVEELFGPDPGLAFIWSRERCTWTFDPDTISHEWAKNLSKIKRMGYHLDQVIMVDDTAAKLTRNYGNLVQVKMFEGDIQDRELPLLMSYLADLKLKDNIRAVEKRGWRARYLRVGASGLTD
jgi:TFIIF-interacting CTD phosphatase-like protein